MNRPVKITLWSITALAAAAAAAAAVIYMTLTAGAVEHPGSVYVPTGATYQTLLDTLGQDGKHLKNIASFRKAAKMAGLEKGPKPGRYILQEGMSYRTVARMFRLGWQNPVKLTFNNIRTIDRLAGSLSTQVEPDSAAFLKAFTDPALAEKYGFEPHTLLAMFIPNTYQVYWNISVEGLCDRMKKEYDSFWTQERQAKLAATGLTRLQASILASIVYEETKITEEMPTVAGVYINRLKIGMPLQADPTVKYAVGDPTIRRVLNAHLTVDSPYNTYKNKGLPPGPICMPSIKAIDAVLDYQHHKYLYFCANPDFSGRHKFATTLSGHNQNARAWADALNRRGIR